MSKPATIVAIETAVAATIVAVNGSGSVLGGVAVGDGDDEG
jgi:hypothetical protein